jgi:MFS family permease
MSSGKQEKTDISGALLFMCMILAMYSGIKLLQAGTSYYLYCLFLVAVALMFGYGFVTWEKKQAASMVDIRMFQNKLFSVSVFCAFLSFFALAGHNFIQPFYLQKVQMLNAAQTGLLMMAYSVTMCLVAPFSGQLSDKIGSEFLCFLGLCVITLALLILSTLGVNSSLAIFLVGSIIMSVGMALFQSPNTSLIMSTVKKSQTGVAGSINALARNLGMVFGISLSTVILYNIMSGKLGYTVMSFVEGEELVFVTAMQWVYRFMAIISAIGAILTGLRWKHRKEQTNGLD